MESPQCQIWTVHSEPALPLWGSCLQLRAGGCNQCSTAVLVRRVAASRINNCRRAVGACGCAPAAIKTPATEATANAGAYPEGGGGARSYSDAA